MERKVFNTMKGRSLEDCSALYSHSDILAISFSKFNSHVSSFNTLISDLQGLV